MIEWQVVADDSRTCTAQMQRGFGQHLARPGPGAERLDRFVVDRDHNNVFMRFLVCGKLHAEVIGLVIKRHKPFRFCGKQKQQRDHQPDEPVAFDQGFLQ